MARIDKYDPVGGGFRARLNWSPVAGEVGDVIAVDLDGNGKAVKSVAGTACVGVVCMSSLMSNGDVIDVMTDGEIVDVAASGDNVTSPAAGALMRAQAGGGLSTAGTTTIAVGRFVEAWRLVVRLGAFTV